MAKPWIHAVSSAKKFGGKPEDYIEIHNLLDSSKGTIADSRHRALTHTAWFVGTILEKIFGVVLTNSEGLKVSVRSVGEQHVLEDWKTKTYSLKKDHGLVGIELEQANALSDVRKLLQSLDDEDFKFLFGDHVRVTAARSGTEVDEYRHDYGADNRTIRRPSLDRIPA